MPLIRPLLLVLCTLSIAWAGGKHLEVMAPYCQQMDYHGRPHCVIERRYETSDTGTQKLISTIRLEFDAEGNLLHEEEVDAANKKLSFADYKYDASGTWVSLVEQLEDEPVKSYQIFVDTASRRVAHVEPKTKQTEFYSYTAQGLINDTLLKTSAGKIIETTTFRRNASSHKEEQILTEKDEGRQSTEYLMQWSDKGFEIHSTFIMRHESDDRLITTYEHPDVDANGNWLICIETSTMHRPNGEKIPLPKETVKREITYHP
ncbi:hypothetical protein [Brevifollis gellanilyticus]|uniref:YD repeat-containing protein n=1 Tax=Brevifollis gellanilyticus TaxID=748831 RepID=A0A512M3K0_9BACT|nr:hypothetical protein [Brevifollis gellanilyticus]GEP41310.1 hypothetical protein BGE01nite_06010 [Brevifollis gellanilyticus]